MEDSKYNTEPLQQDCTSTDIVKLDSWHDLSYWTYTRIKGVARAYFGCQTMVLVINTAYQWVLLFFFFLYELNHIIRWNEHDNTENIIYVGYLDINW